MTFKDLYDKLIRFVNSSPENRIVKSNSKFAIELNQSQLIRGRNLSGSKIAPMYKSEYYADKKNELNKLPGFGTPDLKVSGDLHDGIILDKVGSRWEMLNVDEKASHTSILQYGDVWGLNATNLIKFRQKNDALFVSELGKVFK